MPKLTKRVVDGLKAEGADLLVWDEALPSFGVRVRKGSGRKFYLVKYRFLGLQRWYTLGLHGELTPDQARKRAADALADVRRGVDPAAEKRLAKLRGSVADFWKRYLEQHAQAKKKSSSVAMDEFNWEKHIKPRLGSVRIDAVDREHVTALHHAMRPTPISANRVLALVSKMMNLAEAWGARPLNSNPCRHVERYPETKRRRFLSELELARLGQALSDAAAAEARVEVDGEIKALPIESPGMIAFLRLLILTGCRRDEIRTLRWEHVDFEGRCLRLPDSKTGAKDVPLNAPALAVLESLRSARLSPEWVVPGRGPRTGKRQPRTSAPLMNVAKAWGRIVLRARLDDLRLHDLRHSFAAVGAGSGHSLLLIGGLLGHTQQATTQRYAHLADDPLRRASEAIGGRIAAALDRRPDAEIVPLRGVAS